MDRILPTTTLRCAIAVLSLALIGFHAPRALADGEEASSDQPTVWRCPPCGCEHDGEDFGSEGECPSCGMTLVNQAALRNVAIVIWDGAEVLDWTGPTEVFASARGPGGAFFNVYTVGLTAEPIVSQGVVTVTPQYTIENCPKPDIFVLPGGGTNRPLGNPAMIEWVARSAANAEIAMSVCTGAFVLAAADLLEGKQATTWHGAIDGLRMAAPFTTVHDDARWVDNGNVVTTAGVSAGIDGALHVVSRLCGEQVAWDTAAYMEYDWRPKEVPGLVASPGAAPSYTSNQKIMQLLVNKGADAAFAEYSKVLGTPDELDLPSERAVNTLGYRYLGAGDVEQAIGIFTFNTKAHSDAFNTWDSLAEAYMVDGRKAKAIEYYRKSLELNPDNQNANEKLAELGGD